MIVDGYLPEANFVSARRRAVSAGPDRVWAVLPQLPPALRSSRWALVAAAPLWIAARLRGDSGSRNTDFGRRPWTIHEGAVLAGAFWVDRVDEGKEVVLVGHHTFADFATSFFIEQTGDERSVLHNVTRARFRTAGLGWIYLVGVRVFHDVYIDWMLRRLAGLAEPRS